MTWQLDSPHYVWLVMRWCILVQSLIDYYQKNTLEKIFPEVKTCLQTPYKDASKCRHFVSSPVISVDLGLRSLFLIQHFYIRPSEVPAQSAIRSEKCPYLVTFYVDLDVVLGWMWTDLGSIMIKFGDDLLIFPRKSSVLKTGGRTDGRTENHQAPTRHNSSFHHSI